jgi:hypothetical protein
MLCSDGPTASSSSSEVSPAGAKRVPVGAFCLAEIHLHQERDRAKSRVGRENWLGRSLLVVGFSPARALPDLIHEFASLAYTTTYRFWRFEPQRRIPRPEWHWGIDLCEILYTNLPEAPFHDVRKQGQEGPGSLSRANPDPKKLLRFRGLVSSREGPRLLL